MKPEEWNARFNPSGVRMRAGQHRLGDDLGDRVFADGRRRRAAGQHRISFQHYFETQVEEGRKISE
jgi:hypothetical protein